MAGNEDPGTELSVDDIKTVSEIGPIKALLTPAAELLGQRLKASVEGWLEKKAAENIEEHASKVLPGYAAEEVGEQAQIELFDWAEKAGRVSPSEVERSASVRAALKATLEGEHEDARILVNLTKPEILYLLNPTSSALSPSASFESTFPRETLVQKALLKKVAVTVPFVLEERSGRRKTFHTELTVDLIKLFLIACFMIAGASGIYSFLGVCIFDKPHSVILPRVSNFFGDSFEYSHLLSKLQGNIPFKSFPQWA